MYEMIGCLCCLKHARFLDMLNGCPELKVLLNLYSSKELAAVSDDFFHGLSRQNGIPTANENDLPPADLQSGMLPPAPFASRHQRDASPVRAPANSPLPVESSPMPSDAEHAGVISRIPRKGPWICSICDVQFPSREGLVQHTEICMSTRPYTCHFCGSCFSQRNNLVVHLKLHGEGAKHQCGTCRVQFNRRGDMTKHMKQCKGMELKCSCCSEVFSSIQSRANHTRAVHPRIPTEC